MTILVITISSDSFEGSVGTPARRVILFGTIPTTIPDTTPVIIPPPTQTDTIVIPIETPIIAPTIPPSLDYTPASPDYSPASDSEFDSSKVIHLIHHHHLPVPIPHGRPYRYHLNGPIHMMTARKRVGPLPTHRLAVRHSADHSSLDSSSEASSDFHSDASSDSSSRHSLSDHSSPDLPSTSAGPSRKRRRSPMASVFVLPLVSGALSPVRADLVPSPKRVRDSGYLADVEVDPSEVRLGVDVEDESFEQSRSRGTDLEVDDDVERSEEPHSEPEIDPVEAVIEACFDFADIIRASGVDVRVEAVTVARDDVETSVRDPIVVSDDGDTPPVVSEVIPKPAQEERAVEGTYDTLGDLVQRFHDHIQSYPTPTYTRSCGGEFIRNRGITRGSEAPRVLRVRELDYSEDSNAACHVAEEFENRYDDFDFMIEKILPKNTRSGASMTHEEVEELVTRRVAKEIEAREAARTLEPLNENGDEQEGENGGNGNECEMREIEE
ncbi:hypothetical protein Tco_0995486 [Tanacetum coccineum]